MRLLAFLFLPTLAIAQDVGPIPQSLLVETSLRPVTPPEYTWTLTAGDGTTAITLPMVDRAPYRVRCVPGSLADAVQVDAEGQTVWAGSWMERQFVVDRDTPVSSLLPHVRRGDNAFKHFFLVAIPRDGSLPQPGTLCGLRLQIQPADLEGSMPWDQLPDELPGGLRAVTFHSATPIHFVLERLDAVANAYPPEVFEIAISDDVTPWPNTASTPRTAPVGTATNTAAVLLHRGQPYATFDGPERMVGIQGNPLAVRQGDFVATPSTQASDLQPVNDLWDARFLLQRSYTTHPDHDVVSAVTDPPVWSWSEPVSRDQDVLGALVAQQRNLRVTSELGPEVWEHGTLVGSRTLNYEDRQFTYTLRQPIGSWGSTGVAIDGTVLSFAEHTRMVDDALECRASADGPWTARLHQEQLTGAAQIDRFLYGVEGPRSTPHPFFVPPTDTPQMRAMCVVAAWEAAAAPAPASVPEESVE